MGRRVAKWLVVLGLGLAALVIAADTALRFSRADDWLKDLVVSHVRKKGRDISIDGPVELRLLPRPHITIADVHLRNHRGEQLVEARSASLVISPSALLHGGLDFSPVTLQSPTIAFTVDKDKHSNWDLPPSHTNLPSPEGDIIVNDAKISFLYGPWKDTAITATGGDFSARVGEHSSTYNLSGTMMVSGKPTQIDLALHHTTGRSYAAQISLGQPGIGLELAGTLNELSPQAGFDGHIAAHVDSISPFTDPTGAHTETLSPALLGGISVEGAISLTRKGMKMRDAGFSIRPKRGTGEELSRVPGRVDLEADFAGKQPRLAATIRIPALDFRDFMAQKSDWAGLAHKVAQYSLLAVDSRFGEGDASVAIEIGHGAYNDRTIDDARFRLGLKSHAGTVEASARLPGDATFDLKGNLSGTVKSRRISGSLKVRGNKPAETLKWMLPRALPAPAGDAPLSPFDIEATLSPPAATGPHKVQAEVELNGVKGTADVGLDLAPQTAVDAHISIAALDVLSYVRIGRPLGLNALKLSGIELEAKATIDTERPSLPMATDRAEIAVQRLDVRLAPLPVQPFEPHARPATHVGPIQAIGQWLAALPPKVDTFVHPGQSHSLIEKAFPSVGADLTEVRAWLYHLNFRKPLKLSIGQAAVREANDVPAYRRRDAWVENIALEIIARDAPGPGTTSTVAAALTLGSASAAMTRLTSGTMALEADLDSSESRSRISAIRLARLALAGDVDDMINPAAPPGLIGAEGPPRRLPFALGASGTADPGHADIRLDRAVLGDLMHLNGVRIDASEHRAGLLKIDISNAAAPRPLTTMTASCTLRRELAGRDTILDFTVNLVGDNVLLDSTYGLIDGATASDAPRKPLIGSVLAHGFAESGATVIEALELRLGDASVLAAKFATTSEKHGASQRVSVEGCLDTTLQAKPRLASIGVWSQELAMPMLAPLWEAGTAGVRDPGDAFGARFEGRVELLEDGISSDGPIHLSMRRLGAGTKSDSFDIELDRLQLRLPAGTRASALRIALSGFRFKDPFGGFNLSRPSDVRSNLLTLQRTIPGRGGCEGRPDMDANLRLGSVEHIDIAAVKRFASRVSGLMHGGGPPSPCDPLRLRVTATELHSWPDIVSAFTDSPTIREAAARAPPLHNLDFTLSIDKAHALTYTMATGFRSNQPNAPSCTGRESLQSHGTLSLAQGQKRGELHSVLSCLDLGDAMAIAEAASGHPLSATGISLRHGQLAQLSFDLSLPPGESLRGLDRMSGDVKWAGDVALDIVGSKLAAELEVYGLQEERKNGFRMEGHVALKTGNVTGTFKVRDPRLDSAGTFDGRSDAEKWESVVDIAAHGALGDGSIGAQATIRSSEWKDRVVACTDGPGHDRLNSFPRFVEKLSICIPLAKGAKCSALTRKPLTVDDYRCAGR